MLLLVYNCFYSSFFFLFLHFQKCSFCEYFETFLILNEVNFTFQKLPEGLDRNDGDRWNIYESEVKKIPEAQQKTFTVRFNLWTFCFAIKKHFFLQLSAV